MTKPCPRVNCPTTHDETRIRDRIAGNQVWVNGDAYRDELRKLLNAAGERIHAQAELLEKRAEK